MKKKVAELNQPGRLLPGVELETYYDREDLVHLTTHTVRENLVVGIALVVIILIMFLLPVAHQFHAQHQSHPAHFTDERLTLLQFQQPPLRWAPTTRAFSWMLSRSITSRVARPCVMMVSLGLGGA